MAKNKFLIIISVFSLLLFSKALFASEYPNPVQDKQDACVNSSKADDRYVNPSNVLANLGQVVEQRRSTPSKKNRSRPSRHKGSGAID